jgi:hypothetical protein
MGNVHSPNFAENFEWLSLQSPIFLNNFFALLRTDQKIIRHIHQLNLDINFPPIFKVKELIKRKFNISPQSAFIFGTLIRKDSQGFRGYEQLFPSVNRIILKTQKVPNNFY